MIKALVSAVALALPLNAEAIDYTYGDGATAMLEPHWDLIKFIAKTYDRWEHDKYKHNQIGGVDNIGHSWLATQSCYEESGIRYDHECEPYHAILSVQYHSMDPNYAYNRTDYEWYTARVKSLHRYGSGQSSVSYSTIELRNGEMPKNLLVFY